jgi:hypothetical protein
VFVNVLEFAFQENIRENLAQHPRFIRPLEPVAGCHEKFVPETHPHVRAIHMDQQVAFQQRHFQRPRDELGRVMAVNLSIDGEQHGHVVLDLKNSRAIVSRLSCTVLPSTLFLKNSQKAINSSYRSIAHRLFGQLLQLPFHDQTGEPRLCLRFSDGQQVRDFFCGSRLD